MKTRHLIKFTYLQLLAGLFISVALCSCDRDFLEAKPDKAILVPTSLAHYQALMDNAHNVMNRTPYLGEVSADDFRMAENTFESYQETERNAYLWAERVYSALSVPDWDLPYKQIFYANVVLDALKDHPLNNEEEKNLKGIALFYRGWALFQVAQLFGKPYDPQEAHKTNGVPFRLSADVTLPSQIGTLQDTYERMKSDLKVAMPLLQTEQTVVTRPSKTAAYALMARVHLTMQDYEKAKLYADSSLALQSELLDYNTLDPKKAYPLPALYRNANKNPEVIFLTVLVSNIFLGSSNNTLVDTTLYNSYAENDLRKSIFYNASGLFRGSYMGERTYQFSGLAVDEMFLIRAEANARTGNMAAARDDLNWLLSNRWEKGKYEPFKVNDQLLEKILIERRKELVGRGIRWGDLKRLNQDARFKKVLRRNIAGKEYSLNPQDSRYTLPIPDSEGISLITQ